MRADAAVDAPIDTGPPPISYALDPPNQMMNQFFIPSCQAGVATSPGGGHCTQGQNACEGTKQGAQVNFLCPRFMLFSDEMAQAALDDGYPGLNYGVVGHDVETGGIDGNVTISCCQCYQLVFSLPENGAQVGGNGASAIPIPPPLVVQAFNTSAGGGKNFDVFMGAGGFGAFNACDPNASMTSPSGKYLYTQFPPDGEPGSGGENAATQIAGCKGTNNLTTTASLSATTCQTNVATACGKFKSSSATVTTESIRSCVQSNAPDTYYHINWKIYAKRVECPTHLTQVTGCKLASQGLPQSGGHHARSGCRGFILQVWLHDDDHAGLLHAHLRLAEQRQGPEPCGGGGLRLVLLLRSKRRSSHGGLDGRRGEVNLSFR